MGKTRKSSAYGLKADITHFKTDGAWFHSDWDVKICDVVLFIKNEGSVVNTYQYGMVHEIELSEGGLIWKVFIKDRNSSKSTDCFTTCAVCALVLIHPVDKIHTMGELETLLQ